MSPSAIFLTENDHVTSSRFSGSGKPVLYILSEFHPKAVKHAESLFDCIHYDTPQALKWRSHATAILVKDYNITRADLEAAPQLRVIGKQGVGIEKIDDVACAEHNVKIINTPGVNAGAVAEMVMALAFSVARSIPWIWYRQLAQGETIRKETCSGLLLTGRTIGVIGMGNIGCAVARIFNAAFNTNVIALDNYMPDEPATWKNIPYTRVQSLQELLKASDIVTIHVPLTKETQNMIGAPELELMKKTAILINTARGGIVDETALEEALKAGKIWGAGLDCHEQEPPTREKYQNLWTSGRIVGMPHIAAATDETQIATTNAAINGVYKFMISAISDVDKFNGVS